MNPILVAATASLLCLATAAQNTVQVPLNYNFNGIVHAGERGNPDAANGFRSISDRALDFTTGVPADPVFQRFAVVATAGVKDMVHLGNRNTVDTGNWAFDASPNSNNIGIQPAWLANPNQAGGQVTTIATPIPLGLTSTISVLFHVSNGGGTCDLTCIYQSGAFGIHPITAPDWFGGPFAGCQNVDRGDAGAGLGLTEVVIDIGAHAGDALTQISFSNRSNTNAGYGIYAVNVEAAPTPSMTNHIALACNWNGIVHAGESQQPDAANGYRAIAGRGLSFQTGVPTTALLNGYQLVDQPGALDLVLLGNRNTVGGGAFAFDAAPDGDDVGVQPAWLPDPDLSGPQTTTLPNPILLDGASTASFLFQMTDGGGAFDVTLTLTTGSITATLRGTDWVGGSYVGTANVDRGVTSLPLRIEQGIVDLSAAAGLVLTAITFENLSNPIGNCAILAANVTGCLACPGAGGTQALGGGAGPTLSTTSTGNLGCPLEWTVAGATPGTPFGLFAVSTEAPVAVPLALLFPTCAGTVHVANPALLGAAIDALGGGTLSLQVPSDPALCGLQLTAQYVEPTLNPCPLLLGDALAITIGN